MAFVSHVKKSFSVCHLVGCQMMPNKKTTTFKLNVMFPVDIDMEQILAGMKPTDTLQEIRSAIGYFLKFHFSSDTFVPGDGTDIPTVEDIQAELLKAGLITDE